MNSDEMNEKIRSVICKVNDDIPINLNVDLLDAGYIDSFDIVNIIADLEDTFAIEIAPEDIVPENFRTIEQIAKLITNNVI